MTVVDKRKKTPKHLAEAAAAGLRLLGPSLVRDKNKKNYRFKNCGHSQDIGVKEVREKRLRCQTCLQEKLRLEAEKEDLVLIGAAQNTQYRNYQFNKCLHFQELTTGNVRKGGHHISCATCKQKELISEAEKADLVWIGSGRSAHYGSYKFNKCGHVQELVKSHVREHNFKCHTCIHKNFIKEAKNANLRLLGEASDDLDVSLRKSNYRYYRFDCCGYKKNIRPSHVRDLNFCCENCDDSPLDGPSNVYLLKIKHPSKEWLKLGFAKNVKLRIYGYGLTSGCSVKVRKVIPFDTGFKAKNVEFNIHKKYKFKRLNPVSMKTFHTWSGHSECYETSAEEYLISALSEFA